MVFRKFKYNVLKDTQGSIILSLQLVVDQPLKKIMETVRLIFLHYMLCQLKLGG